MPGRLVFSTTADGASTPTERMRITNAGNVGIGASAPGARLDIRNSDGAAGTVAVFGNTSIGGGLQILTSDGNLDWGFNAANFRNLVFQTNQTERMRIDSAGNVGIGTSSLSATGGQLQVAGSINKASAQIGGNANGMSVLNQNGLTVYTNLSAGNVDTTLVAGNTAGTYMAFGIHNGTSYAERLRIDSSGNVGIGTTSPLGKLKVAIGDVAPAASGNMNTGVIFESGASSRAINIGVNNTAGYSWINAAFANNSGIADNLVLMTGATERARIDSSGNLLVGTTSTVDSAKFVVQDAEGNDFAVGRLSGGNRFVGSSSIYNKTSASAANVFINSSATAYAIVRSTASSARFKENITDWSGNGLEEILKLKPRTFTYKASYYSQPERSFLGLIAEEVATVSSYLVDYENEDGTGQVENVRYANIVVPLIKAIQELKAELDATKAEVAALKGA